VEAGDAEHGVVDAVALETAVASIFQVFIRTKVCWTRARSLRWEVLCSSSLECKRRAEVVDHAIGRGLRHPEQRRSWRSVRLVRQYAATSRTRSSGGRLHGLSLRTDPLPHAATR
jgi:hypothetical protein